MTGDALPAVDRPAHVPPGLVVDFDLWDIPGADQDLHLAMRRVQQANPDIFWTPRNGGHWVATRADDIELIESDYTRFSTHCVTIPKKPENLPRELPQELDPPRHTDLRRPLTFALLPKTVTQMEPKLRELTASLIDNFYHRGECEFISEFAKVFPISVFLDLVNLPREDRHILVPLADQSVRGRDQAVRMEAFRKVREYLGDVIDARRAQPGDDLFSKVVNIEIDGVKISEDDAISYASLVMFGGLDTVASVLSFVTRFLANNPEQRHDLTANLDDESFMRGVIDELLRRHGVASVARMITHDLDFQGIGFKAGDMVLVPNMFIGLDERRVSDPETINFRRSPSIQPGIFGKGAHVCPGAGLARRELRVFLETWLRKIPDFQIQQDKPLITETGIVSTITQLHLSWTPRP